MEKEGKGKSIFWEIFKKNKESCESVFFAKKKNIWQYGNISSFIADVHFTDILSRIFLRNQSFPGYFGEFPIIESTEWFQKPFFTRNICYKSNGDTRRENKYFPEKYIRCRAESAIANE